jgi:catechol 2,3-dioxygenase-like lactoylglutathione lyase family enzyme
VKFYKELFGYTVLESQGDRFCALGVAGEQVLILFKEGGTLETVHMPGGAIPPHDGSGTGHIGFSVPKEALVAWEKILKEREIEIEGRMNWPRGGTSIYFRDPDGHLLELLTPGVWTIY